MFTRALTVEVWTHSQIRRSRKRQFASNFSYPNCDTSKSNVLKRLLPQAPGLNPSLLYERLSYSKTSLLPLAGESQTKRLHQTIFLVTKEPLTSLASSTPASRDPDLLHLVLDEISQVRHLSWASHEKTPGQNGFVSPKSNENSQEQRGGNLMLDFFF